MHFTATSRDEMKRRAKIDNFNPYFLFAYHASLSSDVLTSYWLVVSSLPFRDGDSNGPITQTFLLSH